MPSNKFLLADKSKLLTTKLQKLAENLRGSTQSGGLQTEEQYILEATKVLQDFYKDLTEPSLGTEDVIAIREDDLPETEIYNNLWQSILDDLITVFTELENVENLTVANFNFITTETNRLTSRLKAVSSLLGDFILYSLNPNRDSLFFRDSYNDLSKVDIGISLLNAEECEVHQSEGIVTLPVDRSEDSTILITETPIINPNSNGVIGNNQELGANFNGNLSVLLDNNPDTWFEFERVVTVASDQQEPLILDLTINIGTPDIVNHIRINPNNFGTKTVIKVETIETSIDGITYTSIKDDIPIADFTDEDAESVFSLAPSSSKFAGQAIYTFTPRKTKYVHIVFKQLEPYVITTAVGDRLRYAIGIRDIDITDLTFLNAGEIISTPFQTTDEVRKVLLSSNQNPTQGSELVGIDWFVSPDDGSTWHEIKPKEFTPPSEVVSSVPEILEFNGPSAKTIITSVPVKTLRLKAIMVRNDDSFKLGSSTLNQEISNTSETQAIPQAAPFVLELTNSPVSGSVVLIDPLFGSRGRPESPWILGHGIDERETRKFRLPFKQLPRPLKKVFANNKYHTVPVPANEWMHVEVGGEEWDQTTIPITDHDPNINLNTRRVYNADLLRGVIEFGNGENSRAPGAQEPVTVYFDAEQLFPNEVEDDHVAQLEFHTSSNKEDFTIKRFDDNEDATEVLPRNTTVIELENDNIIDTSKIESSINQMLVTVTGVRIDFLNGQDELTLAGSWSMDNEHGIIYLVTPTPSDSDVSVSYEHQPIFTLSVGDWDWSTVDIVKDSISIQESVWKTRAVTNESLPTSVGTKVIDLSKMSVEKGTLDLNLTVSGVVLAIDDVVNPFQKEVDFIDGTTELGGEIVKTTEKISKSLVATGTGIAFFSLNENISVDVDHDILFSKSGSSFDLSEGIIFINEIFPFTTSPSVLGDYSVDRDSASGTYGQVYVKIGTASESVTDPGSATYFYTSPNFSAAGLYSVNYKMGRLFTQLPLDPASQAPAWLLSATYEYTDFKAEYRIARLVDSDTYTVSIEDATITLKDSEIITYEQIPKGYFADRNRYYLVNYDFVVETRDDIEDLIDSYTPVIKDYALRVLTAGRIF